MSYQVELRFEKQCIDLDINLLLKKICTLMIKKRYGLFALTLKFETQFNLKTVAFKTLQDLKNLPLAGIVVVGIWVVVFEFFGTTVCFVAVILFILGRPPWLFISGVTYSQDDDFAGCTDDVISSYNDDSSPSVAADACDDVDPGTDFDGENGADVNSKVNTFTRCGDGTERERDSDTDEGVNDTDIAADESNDDIVTVVDDANDGEADMDTSDVDAGTVIKEDVAGNNSGVDPDVNDDGIGTDINDNEMEGVTDVNSNDASDNGNFDFDAINDENDDTGSNNDCITEVDDVGYAAFDRGIVNDVDTGLDFSCCFDTGDEEYIAIEAEGAAKLDADIVIEIDVVGDRNDNFEAAIDVDLDSDTENEAANDTGAADDID